MLAKALNGYSRWRQIVSEGQCLFVDRAYFFSQGRFARIPLLEHVEFCKRLRRVAKPLIWSEPVTMSSRRWLQRGVWMSVLSMWSLRLANSLGLSPESLI